MKRSFVVLLLVVLLLLGLGAVAGSLPAAGSAGVPAQPRGSGPVWAPVLAQVGSPALSAGASSARGGEAAPAQNRDYVSDQVIVVFKHGATRAERAQVRRALGASEVVGAPRSPSLPDTYLWSLPHGMGVGWATAALRANGRVKWAQPNRILLPTFTPVDRYFGDQWGLHNLGQPVGSQTGTVDADIDAPEAWNIERGLSSPVVVAVIDSGVDLAHPDLAAKLWTNADEVPDNGLDDDGNGYVDDVHGFNFNGIHQSGGGAVEVVGYSSSAKTAQTITGVGASISWLDLRLALGQGSPSLIVNVRQGLDGTLLAQGAVAASALTADIQTVHIELSATVWLSSGTEYAIEIQRADGSSGTWKYEYAKEEFGAPDYRGGMRFRWDGTVWQPERNDLWFRSDPNGDPDDDQEHGTHVGGIVGAASDNQLGVAGVSHGAQLMAVKFLPLGAGGKIYDIAQALHYAADNGADVVNMSFGHSDGQGDPVEHEAIAYAAGKGVVLVGSAGNEGEKANLASYPGAYDEVICVAATDNRDAHAGFSTFTQYVDVAAPGVDVLSTLPTFWPEDYGLLSGTSMASPHVAGLAALILSYNPYLTPTQVRAIIEDNVQDLGVAGRDDYFGKGRINAYWSLLDTPAAPWPSGTNSLNGGGAVTTSRTVTLGSSVSNAREMRVSPDGGTTWDSWRPYAASVQLTLPDADGARTVTAEYRTVTYRTTSLSDTIVLDRNGPTMTSVASTSHPDPSLWYASSSPTLTWAATDLSAITSYSYTLNRLPAFVDVDTIADTTGTSRTYAGIGDGQWYFHVRGCDANGFWGPVAHVGVKIDTTAPTGSMSINNGAANANSRSVQITSSVSDALTPAASLQMCWSTDGGSNWSTWTSYSTPMPVTLPSTEGAREVRVQYKDLAGNALPLSDTIVLDTTAPTITTLGSATHPDQGTWYPSASPTLTWTASSDMTRIAGYSFELDASPATTPDATVDGGTATKSYTGAATGQRYFHVRACDGAGNWGPVSHFGVKMDTQAPSGEMQVSGGDSAVGSATTWVDSDVTDDFTATADMQMRYSVNAGSTWSGWSAYSDGFEIVLLEPDGPKTVLAEYRDLADNRTQYRYDIYLDRVAPEIWTSTSEEWYQRYTLRFFTEDAGAGVAIVRYRVDGGGWRYKSEGDDMAILFRTWKRGGNSGVHTVDFYCQDWAWNPSQSGQAQIHLDGRPPVTTDDLPWNPATPGVPYTSSLPLTVNLSASDPLSGVWQTWCSLDGVVFAQGTSVVIPAPTNGSNDGLHWVAYYSIDEAGNVEQVRRVPVVIDAAP
jgi:subtilisin family serine protease